MSFEPIGQVALRVLENVRRRHETVEELKSCVGTIGRNAHEAACPAARHDDFVDDIVSQRQRQREVRQANRGETRCTDLHD